MAHALEGYHGKCKHIHGHSYILYITVKGTPDDSKSSPTCGMVMDFGDLKQLVNEHIVSKFDHALVLRKDAKLASELKEGYGNVMLPDYQPTCENLVIHFADVLKKVLPNYVALYKIRLHETATSYADWYATDNA